MADANLLVQEECLNLGTVIEAIIKRSCIIDYGIVQKVVAEGVVDVSVAVAKTEQDIVCMTCVLANIASSSLTVNVVPHVGDRVLVVYPRMYDDKMFAVPDGDTKQNTIVNPVAKGYNLMSGIAILMNQYKKASHENVITVDDGKVNAKLNKVEITTTADGDITLKNPNATVSIDKNGNVAVSAKGKYTFKNDDTDLFTVMSNLNTILKTLKTEGSSSAQTISSDTVTSLTNWENQKLKALLV